MIEVVHIVARVTTDMTRFNAGMASMEAKAKTATAKMSLAGMRMTKYLTLPIMGIGYAGVKMAVSFQDSMTKVQTQAGATARSIPMISAAIKKMSGRDVMQGPKDLADAYYHLQSVFGNTISPAKKLSMLKRIGQVAQIGGSNTEDTTSAVAGILRTHLKGANNVMQVVKTINGIVGSGNMRMPQFVESTGTAVLQVARLLGMSLKQVGAAEAVFTDENMNANMSMTRLRTSLMMAVHPSQAAAKQMQLLGVSSLAIGTKMRSKNGFGKTLDYLSERYDAYVKKLTDQGKSDKVARTMANAALFGSFGGSKGASIWATLVQQHAMFHQKEQQITAKEKNWNKDLAASNATMMVKFKKAWAQIQVALIDFGNALAPIALGAAHAIAKIANAFTSLPTPLQHMVAAVAVGLAVLGPMLIVMGSLIRTITTIGELVGGEGAITLGFGAILPLAIVAAVGALIYFAMKSKTFRDYVKHIFHEVAGFFNWLGKDVIGPFLYKLYRYFADGGKASRWRTMIVPALKAVAHTFKVLADAAKSAFKWVGKALSALPTLGSRFGGYLFDQSGAGDYHYKGPFGPQQRKLLHEIATSHGKQRQKYLNEYHGQYGDHSPRTQHHHPQPHHSKARHPQSHHDAPLVHIGNMNVRHESDAEIVSGKIARKVAIP